MTLVDLIRDKLDEFERGSVCPPAEYRNYVLSGEEVCDNIRWCEFRPVAHPLGVSNIYHIIDNPCVQAEIRQWIANKLGINIDYICQNIQIPVGDFNKWQGTGHFRGADWVRFNPSLNFVRTVKWSARPQRWDIYNIGYYYKLPAPAIPEHILDEISPILDIIQQITSYETSNRNCELESDAIDRENDELREKVEDVKAQETRLKSQVGSFKLVDTICSLNAKQKSHILLKLWGRNDEESGSLIRIIKEYGFDPNYVNIYGQSLITLALDRYDYTLIDYLVCIRINFDTRIGNSSFFHLVINKGIGAFIAKMFSGSHDFSKAVLDVVLKNDAGMLAKLFSYKSALSLVCHSGYSLLQLALKHGCYEAAEKILQTNIGTMNQVAVGGLSALHLAFLMGDKQGVELLKRFGANFELELKNAITKNYLKVVNKMLVASPDLLNKLDTQGKSPLYHALLQSKLPIAEHLLIEGADPKLVLHTALQENNTQMIKDLIALNSDLANLIIDGNKTALYLALEQGKIEIAKVLSESSDLMAVVKLSSEEALADIAVQLLKLVPSVLTKLAEEANCKVTRELLDNTVFTSLVKSVTDNNDNNLLHLSCKNNNYELAIRILEKGQIDVNKQNNEGKTAFHILLESSIGFKEKAQLAEVLLKLHPDIHVLDANGHTPIDLAVEHDAEVLAMFYREKFIVDSTHSIGD